MNKNIFLFVCMLLLSQCLCFTLQTSKQFQRCNLHMKWSFHGEAGSMADLGAIGTEGIDSLDFPHQMFD